MDWKIIFYETNRGEQPVYEYFKKQQPNARSKITHLIDILTLYGNILGLPHSKALGNGLYELRIRGKEEIRITYCFFDITIILLHAFKKQTQKTSTKDIELSLQRMEEVKKIKINT